MWQFLQLGSVKYSAWDKNLTERPEVALRGDIVRLRGKKHMVLTWDQEDGSTVWLLDLEKFSIVTADPRKIKFAQRIGGDEWWTRLPEVGSAVQEFSNRRRREIASIAESLGNLNQIERDAEEFARRHWFAEEIAEAKHGENHE